MRSRVAGCVGEKLITRVTEEGHGKEGPDVAETVAGLEKLSSGPGHTPRAILAAAACVYQETS